MASKVTKLNVEIKKILSARNEMYHKSNVENN